MNILICDDITEESAELAKLINSSGIEANTIIFTNAEEALFHIRSGEAVDVCFLDILMPETSGVELAEKLRRDGFNGELVFLTTSNEYAAQSYRVKAFSYLLKPPSPAEVLAVLQNLEKARARGDTNGILVKSGDKSRFILFREISYVEVIQHKVYYRLTDGAEMDTYGVFAEVLSQLLSDRRFAQCHRSYIVNMSDVSHKAENAFVMRNGAKVPISRGFSEVKKQYIKWVLGESSEE